MTVKELKEYLELYGDEKEVIIYGASGQTYDVISTKIAEKTLTDEKREVCKLYIK